MFSVLTEVAMEKLDQFKPHHLSMLPFAVSSMGSKSKGEELLKQIQDKAAGKMAEFSTLDYLVPLIQATARLGRAKATHSHLVTLTAAGNALLERMNFSKISEVKTAVTLIWSLATLDRLDRAVLASFLKNLPSSISFELSKKAFKQLTQVHALEIFPSMRVEEWPKPLPQVMARYVTLIRQPLASARHLSIQQSLKGLGLNGQVQQRVGPYFVDLLIPGKGFILIDGDSAERFPGKDTLKMRYLLYKAREAWLALWTIPVNEWDSLESEKARQRFLQQRLGLKS